MVPASARRLLSHFDPSKTPPVATDPLEFLAEFAQHIPPQGSHLIRYYGFYSSKARGMRRKAVEAEAAEPGGGEAAEAPTPSRSSQSRTMLIKRVYEIDPLCCLKCQGEMRAIAFLEPPQAEVIEKILRHCGLWHSSRAPPADGDFAHDPADAWHRNIWVRALLVVSRVSSQAPRLRGETMRRTIPRSLPRWQLHRGCDAPGTTPETNARGSVRCTIIYTAGSRLPVGTASRAGGPQ